MNPASPVPLQDRPSWAANFHTRVARYRNLLARWWWLPVLGGALGIGVQLLLIHFAPPEYMSAGRMIVNIRVAGPEGSVYSEELSNFLGTQAALMQSGVVVNRAQSRIAGQKPDLAAAPVKLHVTVLPKTTIFLLQAVGDSPEYTENFLQACMDEYTNLKKEMRNQTSDTTVSGLMAEALRMEQELRKCDEELVRFAGSNSVVVLQEQGNSAGAYLTTLNQRLAAVRFEHEVLKGLTQGTNKESKELRADLIPRLQGMSEAVGPTPAPDVEQQKVRQALTLLRAEEQELGEYLRPQHPKMLVIKEEIARRERLMEAFRQETRQDTEYRKVALALQIQELEKEVQTWNDKALEVSRETAEYQKIKANSQRIQALYDRLLATMQTLDVNKEINAESVTCMEKATPGMLVKADLGKKLPLAALLGIGLSVALLMLIDRLDDRMNSLTEFSQFFSEAVLAQVPRERSGKSRGDLDLLHSEDERHGFVEAFRSLRSSLLYMSESGTPPRAILVTSSEPNEGKSVTSANLAITLASAGARVLLVDADLRKGVLHDRFGLPSQPGLSEALSQGQNWKEMVQATPVPSLSFLPRGKPTQKSGELFLGTTAQKFLKDMIVGYDYVVVDSVPVMAADDVATLAPHMDGVVFVVRAEQTSARVARASMEVLYRRRAQILGVVFNAVRHGSADYYPYYKYKEYYKSHSAA